MCNLNLCVECFILFQHLTFRILVIPKWCFGKQRRPFKPGLYIMLRLKQSSWTEMNHNTSIKSILYR